MGARYPRWGRYTWAIRIPGGRYAGYRYPLVLASFGAGLHPTGLLSSEIYLL